jgi:hypothetical protein
VLALAKPIKSITGVFFPEVTAGIRGLQATAAVEPLLQLCVSGVSHAGSWLAADFCKTHACVGVY